MSELSMHYLNLIREESPFTLPTETFGYNTYDAAIVATKLSKVTGRKLAIACMVNNGVPAIYITESNRPYHFVSHNELMLITKDKIEMAVRVEKSAPALAEIAQFLNSEKDAIRKGFTAFASASLSEEKQIESFTNPEENFEMIEFLWKCKESMTGVSRDDIVKEIRETATNNFTTWDFN